MKKTSKKAPPRRRRRRGSDLRVDRVQVTYRRKENPSLGGAAMGAAGALVGGLVGALAGGLYGFVYTKLAGLSEWTTLGVEEGIIEGAFAGAGFGVYAFTGSKMAAAATVAASALAVAGDIYANKKSTTGTASPLALGAAVATPLLVGGAGGALAG